MNSDQITSGAWQQVENLRNQLGGVPGDVASRALHDTRLTRRHVMKGLPLSSLGAGGGWQLWHWKPAKVCGQITAPPKAQSAVSNW